MIFCKNMRLYFLEQNIQQLLCQHEGDNDPDEITDTSEKANQGVGLKRL